MTQGLTKVELDFYVQTPKFLRQIAEEIEESNKLKRKEIELLRKLLDVQKTEQVDKEGQD